MQNLINKLEKIGYQYQNEYLKPHLEASLKHKENEIFRSDEDTCHTYTQSIEDILKVFERRKRNLLKIKNKGSKKSKHQNVLENEGYQEYHPPKASNSNLSDFLIKIELVQAERALKGLSYNHYIEKTEIQKMIDSNLITNIRTSFRNKDILLDIICACFRLSKHRIFVIVEDELAVFSYSLELKRMIQKGFFKGTSSSGKHDIIGYHTRTGGLDLMPRHKIIFLTVKGFIHETIKNPTLLANTADLYIVSVKSLFAAFNFALQFYDLTRFSGLFQLFFVNDVVVWTLSAKK